MDEPNKLFAAAMLLIAVSCGIIAVCLFFVHRFGPYSEDVKRARLQIAADVAEAKRSFHALESSTFQLVEELYKLRRAMYPPRTSPPNGSPPPTQRTA